LLRQRGAYLQAWDANFPEHDPITGRLQGVEPYDTATFERLCREQDAKARGAGFYHKRKDWPASLLTPQVVVEAIWHSVREGGVAALDEPANQERLSRCDQPARAELKRRIAKLGAVR